MFAIIHDKSHALYFWLITERKYMFNHMWLLLTSATIHAHEHEVSISAVDDTNMVKPIMYCICVDEKTGRFEKQ